jgi:hypothetical protein
MQAKFISAIVVAKERKKGFEISWMSRFRYRTRYFTDSGIIGSKEFVAEIYQRFRYLFHSKHEKSQNRSKAWMGFIR